MIYDKHGVEIEQVYNYKFVKHVCEKLVENVCDKLCKEVCGKLCKKACDKYWWVYKYMQDHELDNDDSSTDVSENATDVIYMTQMISNVQFK